MKIILAKLTDDQQNPDLIIHSDQKQSLMPSADMIQLFWTLKMASTQVIETVSLCRQQSYSGIHSTRPVPPTYETV